MALIISSLIIAGCSKSSSDIIIERTSLVKYETLTCKILKQEILFLENKAQVMSRKVDSVKEIQDNKETAAWLFFLPALLFIDDNSSEAKKYAVLKGDFEAAETVYRRKKCSMSK